MIVFEQLLSPLHNVVSGKVSMWLNQRSHVAVLLLVFPVGLFVVIPIPDSVVLLVHREGIIW